MRLQRLKQGDSFPAISAATWNTICDFVEQGMRERAFVAPGTLQVERHSGIVYLRNETGDTVPQFSILEITGSVFVPNTNYASGTSAEIAQRQKLALAFKQQVAIAGDIPTANATKLAVLTEPLRDDSIGLAVVSGVVHVRVKMNDDAHEFAIALDGEHEYLTSASSGPVRLLYVQPDAERDPGDADNLAWCVAMLGGGGGGPMYVTLKQAGGSVGSDTVACSLAYDLWPEFEMEETTPFSDTTRRIATSKQPAKVQRTAIGKYIAAADGSLGLAYLNADDTYSLLIAFDEQADTERECV